MITQLRRWCWSVAARTPLPLPAIHLHDAALWAAQERDFDLAERLFERAATACRENLLVERLAHVRVHQLFVRAAARGPVIPLTDARDADERMRRLRGQAPAIWTSRADEALAGAATDVAA